MPWLPQPERVLGPVGSFNLFDPPLCVFPAPKRRANRAVPRITVLGAWSPSPPPPPEPEPRIQDRDANAPVNAIHVCRRLRALKAALDDMPGHAIRFARREARLRIQLEFKPESAGPRQRAVPDSGLPLTKKSGLRTRTTREF